MSATSFDDLEEGQKSPNREPFFKLPLDKDDKDSQKKVLEWLKTERDYLLEANRDRFERLKKNLALNKGIMYNDQETRDGETKDNSQSRKRSVKKLVINQLREANRVRASKILKYKPAVAILPTNDELSDKVAADACEKLKDHIWYEQRFDGEKLPEIIDAKGPMGECYLFIEWNPELGDIHEEYKKAQKYQKEHKLERVPLLGDDGKQDKGEDGEPIWVEKPVKNGDVEYYVVLATDVLVDRHPSKIFRNARFCFRRDLRNVYEARLAYPKGAEHINANKDANLFDYEMMQTYRSDTECELWHFYHRRHETLDKGRYIVFTDDGICASTDFPYSHRLLPCVRWVDSKNPGEMHGSSFFDDVKGASGAYNNLTNMILRNEILVGHPKWMMPAGAANIQELGNAITVVQYKGPVAPALVQANPTGQGAYNLRQSLEDLVFRQSDVSRQGNGTAPPGITAAVALQYLAELEQERWNSPVLIHNECVLQTVIMTLAVAGDFYDTSDKRWIRVQGDDGEWQSEFFDSAVLAKSYDIRIQGSSALPESKSARLETLLFLQQKFPDRVDPEQILDLFDFAQSKKFIHEGTASIRAAEAENEMLLTVKFAAGNDKNQKKVAHPPEPYEDHISHWKTHVRRMRMWNFKNRTDKDLRDALIDHVMGHEALMVDLALKDPAYAQQLAALTGFPLFFVAKPELDSLPATAGDQMLAAPGVPYNAPVDGGEPIAPEDQVPVQPMDGAPAAETLPPVDQQLGLEQEPQTPTSGV